MADASLSPMMQQYRELKARDPDAILLFRMGDFYEMFGEDAVQGARLLELTLTARNRGKPDEIPMAGVAGWEIKVGWAGLPVSWTPLEPGDVAGWRMNEVRLLDVDAESARKHRCKSVAVLRRGNYVPGKDLETVLQQLFGIR